MAGWTQKGNASVASRTPTVDRFIPDAPLGQVRVLGFLRTCSYGAVRQPFRRLVERESSRKVLSRAVAPARQISPPSAEAMWVRRNLHWPAIESDVPPERRLLRLYKYAGLLEGRRSPCKESSVKKRSQKKMILMKETVALLESAQPEPLHLVAGALVSAVISGEYPCERDLFCDSH